MVSTSLQTKQIRLKTSTHTNKQKGDGNVEGTDAHTASEAAPKGKRGRPSKARADAGSAKAMQDLLSANALVCQRILADKAQRDNASSKSALDEVATLLIRLLA